jgi:hypothetical protein
MALARAHSSEISFEWKNVRIEIINFKSIKDYASESDKTQYVNGRAKIKNICQNNLK